MKKLLIASVSMLALSAGAAFAQTSSSDLYQNGNSNAATVNQANDGSSSVYSFVHQGDGTYGNAAYNSSASVTQIGNSYATTNSGVIQNDSYQSATVNQNNAAGGTQNSGITQSNYGNSANVTQVTVNAWDSQYSSVTQSGQYGSVTVAQNGPADSSTVTQSGYGSNPSWAGGSTAYQYVAGGVNVSQSGSSSNQSSVTQSSDFSGAAVVQNGDWGTNLSSLTQSGGSGNIASVWQTASNGVTNTSTLAQIGNGNVAGVYQH